MKYHQILTAFQLHILINRNSIKKKKKNSKQNRHERFFLMFFFMNTIDM